MNIDLTNKRVVVTGAGKGIGREICLLLHKCGAHVIAVSRSPEDLESLKKEIKCDTFCVDLADGMLTVLHAA